ncbi:fused MFS/spermidine synthase [Acidobacteriota bacterium]
MKLSIPPLGLGFLACSFQIILIREFSAHFYGNEITFGLLLGSWLLWGALGSIAAGKFAYSRTKTFRLYYVLVFLFPLCLLCLRFSRFLLGIRPGEMTGIMPMLIFSLVLAMFISFPLGMLFVFNIHLQDGDLSRVYFLESLGAAAAGLVIYFIFIPLFSNWQSAVIIGALVSFAIFGIQGKRKEAISLVPLAIFLIAFFLFDLPSQKIIWKPFQLIQSKDSRYGKLQLLQTEEQISLYNNNHSVYSYPDLFSSEESVHLAMIQHPEAKNILLIGGGIGGSLKQALKYPMEQIDYVELDPEIIHISLPHLPNQENAILNHRRVQIYYQDGRAYLAGSGKRYDVIILNIAEPATAQLNRFYTLEFFRLAKTHLEDRGLFSFRVPSAENYISPELQNFLSSLFFTLSEVFPFVEIIPGRANIFLASDRPLSLDVGEIEEKYKKAGLENTYIIPQILFSRLSPLRIERLKETVASGRKAINQDLAPISYFYNSVLWSTRFGGIETKLFSSLASINSFWLLDIPLIFFLLFLIFMGVRRKTSYFVLTPLAVMGFTTIATEILLIIAYQALSGYLYQRVALLFAAFMIGLSCGAFLGMRRKEAHFTQIMLDQAGFILLLVFGLFVLKTLQYEIMFFLLLLGLGLLGGDLFIVSNRLFLREKRNYGLGYGLDLLGSFAGAIVISSVLIPLVGLLTLLKYLLLMNSFCLLFLAWGLKARRLK